MSSADDVKRAVIYSPQTGVFTWRYREEMPAKWNARFAGKQAGSVRKTTGYLIICVNGVRYQAHRVAWLCMVGDWPRSLIDHVNMDKLDNRWENLRSASASQNKANMRARSDNTSGYKGVYFKKANGKWGASIGVNGRQIHLGLFSNIHDAAKAYEVAAKKHFFEFARTQ